MFQLPSNEVLSSLEGAERLLKDRAVSERQKVQESVQASIDSQKANQGWK